MTTFSTNPRVTGDRNFVFAIAPGTALGDQIAAQVGGVDATVEETVVLHPIPGVGSSTVAFLRGRNNTFPSVALVGPDGVVAGAVDLHRFRHNVARLARAGFLAREDNVAASAAIVVNSSGRELPPHQVAELLALSGATELVVAELQLGQVDLSRSDLSEWLLSSLISALEGAGVGKSVATRPVVAVTAGLSPVNAILVTALHALCESWPAQPVAENRDGIFHFTSLIRLEEMEALGRAATAAAAPVLVSKEDLRVLLEMATDPEAEVVTRLQALIS